MRKLVSALCLMFAISPLSMAQDKAAKEPSAAQKAQQERMKGCNDKAGAKSLKGDERKAFMSSCLKGGDAAAPPKKK